MSYDASFNRDKWERFIKVLTEQGQVHSSVAEFHVFVSCNSKSEWHGFL